MPRLQHLSAIRTIEEPLLKGGHHGDLSDSYYLD